MALSYYTPRPQAKTSFTRSAASRNKMAEKRLGY